MNNRWIFVIIAVLLVAGLSLVAYNMCVLHPRTFVGEPGAIGYPGPHFASYPWGFGFFLLPLFFMLLCFLLGKNVRPGARRRGGLCCAPFDELRRRARKTPGG